jgi:hypothetical protein
MWQGIICDKRDRHRVSELREGTPTDYAALKSIVYEELGPDRIDRP